MTQIQGQGEVKRWTIPEIVISLCHDDEPRNELTTPDSNVAGEKELANVKSWDDKCLVPSCQHTCFDGQNIKSVLPMEKSLTDSHLPVPSVENITSDSVGEEVVPEKRDVKNKEKSLTDRHLPVPSVENITSDSVGAEVVPEKGDVKNKENALTDNHLPVPSEENIAFDPTGVEGATKMQDVKDEVK